MEGPVHFRSVLTVGGLFVAATLVVSAQPVFRGTEIFPPEEFAARREKVIAQIGDAVAIVLGATEPPGEVPFRQNSQAFYLSGVVEPRAIVLIDGRTKQTTVFLQPADARRDASMFGPALAPGAETAKALGVDAVLPRAEFTATVTALAQDRRTIYAPFAAEVLGSQSQGDPTRLWTANKADPWDGRDSREASFIDKLKLASPSSEIKNLDPIVNALRAVKSPREIAILREATRIAGDGIIAAMRRARPGLHEYELQAEAEYVFKNAGAQGASYFALIATGRNTYYTHYHRATATLADGDLVQFDYAPDYKYYQSDVTRVFPANGKFTPRQREYYEIYLKLYQALLTSIAVHKTPGEVIAMAVTKMAAIMASYRFTDERIRTAAAKMVDGFRARKDARGLGHNVGLEVHDVGGLQAPTLEPGRVFTIEPQMRLEDEHLGVRLEDMILITDTGYENLSQFVPIEVRDIEKLMSATGIKRSDKDEVSDAAPNAAPGTHFAGNRKVRPIASGAITMNNVAGSSAFDHATGPPQSQHSPSASRQPPVTTSTTFATRIRNSTSRYG
jgi:Xaa-Pro aminopeptidase